MRHRWWVCALLWIPVLCAGWMGGRIPVPPGQAPANASEESPPAGPVGSQALASQPGEVRGVWIHTYSPTDWDRVMRRLRETGFNSIFVRVGRGGNVIYPSALLPRDAWAEAAEGDELQRAIAAAERYGIDSHAWRVCFHMRSAPKSYYERMASEDRLVRDAAGKQSYWANPGDPRNCELEYQAVMELVRRYRVQGVHLDYIRYPDDPHYDFDYGPVSRAAFEKACGRKVARWPDDVVSGPLKRAYEDWERDNINRLVERIYRGVKRARPEVKVSAAVWRNHRRYRAVIKQDWPLWVERGWLDFVVPMDYTADDAVFADTVKAQVALAGGRMPVVAGIGTWLQPTVEDVVHQVDLARRAGASGHVLFAYNDRRIDAIVDALAAGAHRQPAVPAYVAPPVRFALSEALARKDMPHAVAVGVPFGVEVRIGELRHRWRVPAFDVRIEASDGECTATLGRLTPSRRHLKARASLPRGDFQVVVRGGSGPQQLVVRGPLLQSLPAEAFAEWRLREVPPAAIGEGRRVGVYAEGLGAASVLAALRDSGVSGVVPIYRLRADHVAAVHTLILPQLQDVADLTADAESVLRRWVQQGGTLILTHDAVGFRWHPTLFPEIGRGASLAKRQPLVLRLPGQADQRLTYAYGDHVRITPAPSARVMAREEGQDGAPVVVAGDFGQGHVFLVGILPGVAGDGTLQPGEVLLLRTLLDL